MFLEVEKQIKIMCDRENFTVDQKILTDIFLYLLQEIKVSESKMHTYLCFFYPDV